MLTPIKDTHHDLVRLFLNQSKVSQQRGVKIKNQIQFAEYKVDTGLQYHEVWVRSCCVLSA